MFYKNVSNKTYFLVCNFCNTKYKNFSSLFYMLNLHKYRHFLNKMSILIIIYKLVVPFKNISYFVDYCKVIDQIVIYKNLSKIKTVQFANFLLCCHIVNLIYTAIAPLNDLQRLIYYDASNLLLNFPTINIFVSTNAAAACYLNYSLFLNVDYNLLQLFQSIVIKKEKSFFIWPKYQNQSIPDIVQQKFVILLNLFMGLLSIAGKKTTFNYVLHLVICIL